MCKKLSAIALVFFIVNSDISIAWAGAASNPSRGYADDTFAQMILQNPKRSEVIEPAFGKITKFSNKAGGSLIQAYIAMFVVILIQEYKRRTNAAETQFKENNLRDLETKTVDDVSIGMQMLFTSGDTIFSDALSSAEVLVIKALLTQVLNHGVLFEACTSFLTALGQSFLETMAGQLIRSASGYVKRNPAKYQLTSDESTQLDLLETNDGPTYFFSGLKLRGGLVTQRAYSKVKLALFELFRTNYEISDMFVEQVLIGATSGKNLTVIETSVLAGLVRRQVIKGRTFEDIGHLRLALLTIPITFGVGVLSTMLPPWFGDIQESEIQGRLGNFILSNPLLMGSPPLAGELKDLSKLDSVLAKRAHTRERQINLHMSLMDMSIGRLNTITVDELFMQKKSQESDKQVLAMLSRHQSEIGEPLNIQTAQKVKGQLSLWEKWDQYQIEKYQEIFTSQSKAVKQIYQSELWQLQDFLGHYAVNRFAKSRLVAEETNMRLVLEKMNDFVDGFQSGLLLTKTSVQQYKYDARFVRDRKNLAAIAFWGFRESDVLSGNF